MQITFNTSRLYTARGQVITAALNVETGMVVFNDHSRMVTGGYAIESGDPATVAKMWERHPELFARNVMHRYDAGRTHDIPMKEYLQARDLREGDNVLVYRL